MPISERKTHFPLRTGAVGRGTPEIREGYWEGYYEPSWIPRYMQTRTHNESLYQAALAGKGETKSFLTVLIPHPPEVDAAALAESIRVLSSKDRRAPASRQRTVRAVVGPCKDCRGRRSAVDSSLFYGVWWAGAAPLVPVDRSAPHA